jgi:ribosomal-protein-alanine N-acetyltransferase
MRLRPYRPADFQRLYEIDQSCFPSGISYLRQELEQFVGHRTSKTWVAEEGGAIAGFMIADREPGGVGHIVTIDVVEDRRRRGVGTKLMDLGEDWARRQGLELVYLETAEDNVAAQRFYAARGYVKYEKLESYYLNGMAAWVMVKWLKLRRPLGDK